MMLSDRIVIMNHGRVEQIGTPREIYARPQTLFAATFVGENNVFLRQRVSLPYGQRNSFPSGNRVPRRTA